MDGVSVLEAPASPSAAAPRGVDGDELERHMMAPPRSGQAVIAGVSLLHAPGKVAHASPSRGGRGGREGRQGRALPPPDMLTAAGLDERREIATCSCAKWTSALTRSCALRCDEPAALPISSSLACAALPISSLVFEISLPISSSLACARRCHRGELGERPERRCAGSRAYQGRGPRGLVGVPREERGSGSAPPTASEGGSGSGLHHSVPVADEHAPARRRGADEAVEARACPSDGSAAGSAAGEAVREPPRGAAACEQADRKTGEGGVRVGVAAPSSNGATCALRRPSGSRRWLKALVMERPAWPMADSRLSRAGVRASNRAQSAHRRRPSCAERGRVTGVSAAVLRRAARPSCVSHANVFRISPYLAISPHISLLRLARERLPLERLH